MIEGGNFVVRCGHVISGDVGALFGRIKFATITMTGEKAKDSLHELPMRMDESNWREVRGSGAEDDDVARGGGHDVAVACTQAIRADGACLVPITTNTFKKLFSLPGVDGELPAKKVRREFVDSTFRQRDEAGRALVGSIKIWDETKEVGSVRF